MNIDASLTISRNNEGMILIAIRDCISGQRFVELSMAPADFAMALTGLAQVDATEAVVRSLDAVGKYKIIERRSIKCPISTYDGADKLRAWLREHGKEDGWIVDDYLGSRGSINLSEGDVTLNYRVYRYEVRPTTT